ncbi:hypothetical protein [Bacteriophage Titan-X]|uniref:Lipoprotein n=1 Tax=Bacteriophage Titan-X TaxID=2662140 RepID=A0A5Q2UBU7_9CAUD|nr:hypothetical protein [Bacteriophage Titan-X]
MKGFAVVVAFVLFLAGCVYFPHIVGRYQCSKYGELTERSTKYSAWTGCLVKTQAGWRAVKEQRTIDTEEDN